MSDDSLPDDERLIAFINASPEPPRVKEIARAFGIKSDGRAVLRKRLRQLADAGKIEIGNRRRVSSPARLPQVLVLEIISVNDDGEGIARAGESRFADGIAKITVLADRRRGRAFTAGERVLARLTMTAPDEYDAKIIRKIGHRDDSAKVFGIAVKRTRGGFILEPAMRNPRAAPDLLPPEKNGTGFKNGDMVEAEILSSRGASYTGKRARVLRNLGPATGPAAYPVLTIAEFGIRHAFPSPALTEAADASPPRMEPPREDLRDLPLVTIDGKDAKDFDDAVFATPHATGHRIIVAIADVAHFVRPGSALDDEAKRRGNSVYFPNHVVPMLPEALSNGLCSLVPHEDRACLAVEMLIDKNGQKKSHRFFRAMICSAARLTYDEVEQFRTTNKITGIDGAIINNLLAAYQCLADARSKRGALELDLPERRVRFDDDGAPVAIEKKHQTVSQKLIEEFMILANISAAETLENAKRVCVFRAHEPPAPDKIDALASLARAMKLPFAKGQAMRPQHFNALLAAAKKKNDPAGFALLNENILRAQSQADYRITNPGHFGLGLRRYAHFTSPIRRYSDLMVHREIINHLENRKTGTRREDAAQTAMDISETERTATAAERRCVDRLAAHIMQSRAGDITDGTITSVASFGAFIDIDNSGIEGLLPFNRMPDDYYEADTTRGIITGRHGGITLKTSETVSVMVAEVHPMRGAIALGYAGGGGGNRGGKKRGKSKSSGRRPRHGSRRRRH